MLLGLVGGSGASGVNVRPGADTEGPLAGHISCARVRIPNMTEAISYYRAARICWPNPTEVQALRLPTPSLHLFAHADFGGGPMASAYDKLQSQIASYNFVVAEYLSCTVDQARQEGG